MADWQKTKDAADVVDYQIDWSTWLETGETISTSSWSVDTGLTKDSDSNTTTTATIWVSSGTAGTAYKAYNTITTSAGRTQKKYIEIIIQEQAAV